MRRRRFTTSKWKQPALLATVAILFCLAAAAAFTDARLAIGVALALAVGVLVAVAVRSRSRGSQRELIEPSFETSILAFPPEPRLERRSRM